MANFFAALQCSNRAERQKDKFYYRFSSIIKNNGEEGLKLSKLTKD